MLRVNMWTPKGKHDLKIPWLDTKKRIGKLMNPLQLAAITGLIAAFKAVRGLDAKYVIVPNGNVVTVSNYVINPLSVCVLISEFFDGTDREIADYPVIEIRKTGKFALPTIRSYRESAGQNTLLPYPQGATAFDAALFADSHTRKQNGAWLRRSPQAATAAMTGAIGNPATGNPAALGTLPVPVGVSAETGQDTAKLTAEIQGKAKQGKDGK